MDGISQLAEPHYLSELITQVIRTSQVSAPVWVSIIAWVIPTLSDPLLSKCT